MATISPENQSISELEQNIHSLIDYYLSIKAENKQLLRQVAKLEQQCESLRNKNQIVVKKLKPLIANLRQLTEEKS